MSVNLTVSSAPHIRGNDNTRKIMLDVLIALVPALIAAVYFYGGRALVLTLVSAAACVVFEALLCLVLRKPVSVGGLSAVVAGVVLGVGADLAEDDAALQAAVGAFYTPLVAYSFMIFNLLCAPCFAAMGAIKREMNNWKWTLGAIGYMCGLAYVVSFIVYQIGSLFVGGGFGVGTVIAILAVIAIVYLLVRKNKYDEEHLGSVSAVRASGN